MKSTHKPRRDNKQRPLKHLKAAFYHSLAQLVREVWQGFCIGSGCFLTFNIPPLANKPAYRDIWRDTASCILVVVDTEQMTSSASANQFSAKLWVMWCRDVVMSTQMEHGKITIITLTSVQMVCNLCTSTSLNLHFRVFCWFWFMTSGLFVVVVLFWPIPFVAYRLVLHITEVWRTFESNPMESFQHETCLAFSIFSPLEPRCCPVSNHCCLFFGDELHWMLLTCHLHSGEVQN